MSRDGREFCVMVCLFVAGRLSVEPGSFWRATLILMLGIAAGLVPVLVERWQIKRWRAKYGGR